MTKMSRKQQMAMFAQKRHGLNTVTVKRLSPKDHPNPRFQVNVNGKGAFMPSNKALTKQHLRSAIQSAKSADKTGRKINQ